MAHPQSAGWITASQVFAVLILIVCYIIGIPLLIYCLKTFHAHQDKAYFMKRNTKLFWIFIVFLCIYILICGPMEAFSERGHLIRYSWYSPFATVMIQGIVVSALLLSNMGRFWYIFVQIRVSQERAEWKKILNPNYESWVEKYYNYISNWKYIVLLNVIILSLLVIVVISVGFGGETGSETWTGRTLMSFIFFCGISQFILFSLMQFVDYWYIRDEYIKYFYFLFIGIILIVLVSGSGLLFASDRIGYFNYTFITFVACSLFLFYLFYATKIIILLNENRSKKYKSSNAKSSEPLTTKFKQFVSTKEGYSELMQHITREFSTETLLFLTVLIHFQNFLIEFDYLRAEFLLIKHSTFDIPNDIPKPPIIESQTNKLRKRKEKEKEKEKEIVSAQRSKSQTDILHISGMKERMHRRANSDSIKKEAIKQLFAFKKQSFKKLHEGTPSHSFENEGANGINGAGLKQPDKLSLTTTHSTDEQNNNTNNIDAHSINNINNTSVSALMVLTSISSNTPEAEVDVDENQNENEINTNINMNVNNNEVEAEDEEDEEDEKAMIIHKKSIAARLNKLKLNEVNQRNVISHSSPNIVVAMADLSPLPVEDESDIFTSSIDFSALIPIYDMMYRRFIVRGSAPMEINISYSCATKLMSSHKTMMSSHRYGMKIRDWKELFLNLKDAGKQTLRLLHDSYSRFKFQTNLIQTQPTNIYLD